MSEIDYMGVRFEENYESLMWSCFRCDEVIAEVEDGDTLDVIRSLLEGHWESEHN